MPNARLAARRILRKAIDEAVRALTGGSDSIMVEPEDEYLTKEEVRARLKLNSLAMVDQLVREGVIPVNKLGRQTPRFNWLEVKTAIRNRQRPTAEVRS